MYIHVRVKQALPRGEYGQLELERLVIRREIFWVESVRTKRGGREREKRRRRILALSAIREDVGWDL